MGQQIEWKLRLNELFNVIQRSILSLCRWSFVSATLSPHNICYFSFLFPPLFALAHYSQNSNLCVLVCAHACVHVFFLYTYSIACVLLASLLGSVSVCTLYEGH